MGASISNQKNDVEKAETERVVIEKTEDKIILSFIDTHERYILIENGKNSTLARFLRELSQVINYSDLFFHDLEIDQEQNNQHEQIDITDEIDSGKSLYKLVKDPKLVAIWDLIRYKFDYVENLLRKLEEDLKKADEHKKTDHIISILQNSTNSELLEISKLKTDFIEQMGYYLNDPTNTQLPFDSLKDLYNRIKNKEENFLFNEENRKKEPEYN